MEDKEIIQATCPECRGPLTKVGHDHIHEYECLVGHKYSARALLKAHSETEERALWAAVVALEEARVMTDAIAEEFTPEIAHRLALQSELKQRQALDVRKILERLEPFQTE